jgi:hypothetical protein
VGNFNHLSFVKRVIYSAATSDCLGKTAEVELSFSCCNKTVKCTPMVDYIFFGMNYLLQFTLLGGHTFKCLTYGILHKKEVILLRRFQQSLTSRDFMYPWFSIYIVLSSTVFGFLYLWFVRTRQQWPTFEPRGLYLLGTRLYWQLEPSSHPNTLFIGARIAQRGD